MDALLLSKYEAAAALGISIRSLEHLISRGDIFTRKIGRRVLIPRFALETFAHNSANQPSKSNENEQHNGTENRDKTSVRNGDLSEDLGISTSSSNPINH